MPTLTRFYGITIRMYYMQAEHNPPHVHAIYGKSAAAFDIKTRRILDGSLPPKAAELVREWIVANESDLLDIWATQQFRKLPPLE